MVRCYNFVIQTNVIKHTFKQEYPYLRKYHSIAVGETGPDRGAWKVTLGNISPEHITWWTCKDVKPYEFFVLDSKVGDNDE